MKHALVVRVPPVLNTQTGDLKPTLEGNGTTTGSNSVGSAADYKPDWGWFKRDKTPATKPIRSSPSPSASAHAVGQAQSNVLELVAWKARDFGSQD